MKRGFVDLQVNGYLGIDFSSPDLTLDKIRFVTAELVKRGTIAYCPTVVSSSFEVYQNNLPLIAKSIEYPDLAPHILGIHLEGPFISPEDGPRGAHSKDFVVLPDIGKYKKFQKLADGKIVIVTLAPELEGARKLIRYIVQEGHTAVSLGHHNADRKTIKMACQQGASCSTHLGNGISNTIPRHNNPIWIQLAEDALTGMFITDGFHVPGEFIKVALRAKTADRFIVTSDSSSIAGMPPGEYEISGRKFILDKDGKVSLANTGYLAGSSSNMKQCMDALASLGLLTEDELWRVGFTNPLRVLNKKI